MKIIKLIQHLWKKHEEAMNYLFWGGVAFLLSIILFHIFANMMNLYEQIANTLSWIICVIFTYLTNRFFVFKSKTRGLKRVIKEFTDFVTARIITLVMENAILFVIIDLLTIHNMIAKLVGQFVVIVSNYILSKLWIFKKEKKDESERKTG